jgi:hypothetical protein
VQFDPAIRPVSATCAELADLGVMQALAPGGPRAPIRWPHGRLTVAWPSASTRRRAERPCGASNHGPKPTGVTRLPSLPACCV